MKVGIIFTNYGPYHLARFRAFSNHCEQLGWEAVGIELARTEALYPWQRSLSDCNLSITSVITNQPLESVSIKVLLPKLFQVLSASNPDVLAIAGYGYVGMLGALAWCEWHRKPRILFSDSTAEDMPRSSWREAIKQTLVSRFQAAVVAGQPQKRYLQSLGCDPKSMFFGFDVVENATFHPNHVRSLPTPLNRPYFLCISRLAPEKNLIQLLKAYAAYREACKTVTWDLVICGDGPSRSSIQELIHTLHLDAVVHLPGFLVQAELLPYFGHAQCLILASTKEPWGLVVNEAMAAGLPVLLSRCCGCYEDLLIEGVNGFGFDPNNLQEMVDLMVKISASSEQRAQMGEAAWQHIQAFSPDYFAENLIQATQYAVGQFKPNYLVTPNTSISL